VPGPVKPIRLTHWLRSAIRPAGWLGHVLRILKGADDATGDLPLAEEISGSRPYVRAEPTSAKRQVTMRIGASRGARGRVELCGRRSEAAAASSGLPSSMERVAFKRGRLSRESFSLWTESMSDGMRES